MPPSQDNLAMAAIKFLNTIARGVFSSTLGRSGGA